MANLIGVQIGTPIVWADIGGDFDDTPETGTHQLTLGSLGSALAREGAKADMASIATTHLANRFAFMLRIEPEVAPVSGTTIDVYWGASPSVTAGSYNPGLLTGVDADYAGSAGDSLADTLLQLQFIGSLSLTLDTDPVIQQGTWVTSLPMRYGIPVIVNNSGQALHATDDKMSLIAYPLEDEAQ